MYNNQVKQTQIVPERDARVNPYSSFPSDLKGLRRGLPQDVPLEETSESGELGSEEGEEGGSPEPQLLQTLGASDFTVVDPTPGTPAILGVKEQVVGFNPDGTAKIDLVLEIQDVEGAVEYDVRVAKDAGNL